MPTVVTRLALGSGAFGVNAYLLETGSGFVLVDTGMRSQRASLERRLSDAGCTRGALKLMFITHGDFDHIGNAAHLQREFDAPIAMHRNDADMAANGDMFAGRQSPGWFARRILPLLVRLPETHRFEPGVLLDEGFDLAGYGLPDSQVLLVPGHSSGSVALLLEDGSLFCGDVLENRSEPKLGSIMDDVPAAQRSVERLQTLSVATVYPGHGAPFPMADLVQSTDSR